MSAKEVMGGEKLPAKFAEQGTPASGYAEDGPYHCEDCRHRTAPDEPFCIHPMVLKDPKLKTKRTEINGRKVVRVNMEHGCCRYVSQARDEDEE